MAANWRVSRWRRQNLPGAVLALAATLAVPAAAAAQPGGQPPGPRRFAGMPHGGMAPMVFGLRQLDLTQEQRQQVRDVMQRHREEFKTLGAQMRTAREALRTATSSEVVDPTAVRAATGEIAEAQAQSAILRARVRQEVLGLLTPEQQEKAKALQAETEHRMQLRRQRMEQRFSQPPKAPPQ